MAGLQDMVTGMGELLKSLGKPAQRPQSQARPRPGQAQNDVEEPPPEPPATMVGKALTAKKRRGLKGELDEHGKYLHKAFDELAARGKLGLDEFVGVKEHLHSLVDKHAETHAEAFAEPGTVDEHRAHAQSIVDAIWDKHVGSKLEDAQQKADKTKTKASKKKAVADLQKSLADLVYNDGVDFDLSDLVKASDNLVEMAGSSQDGDLLCCLQYLLGLLIAMERVFQAAHWQALGPNFQADHDLFAALYEGVDAEYDALGEKIVAIFGNPAVEAWRIEQLAQRHVENLTDEPDMVLRALRAEAELQDRILGIIGMAGVSPGLDNLLAGIADAHETNTYKLQQRSGTAGCCGEDSMNKSMSDLVTESDNLLKSLDGEGSRGGKIIGHSKSGKPIYESSKVPKEGFDPHKHLTTEEHEAAKHVAGYGLDLQHPQGKANHKEFTSHYGQTIAELRGTKHHEALLKDVAEAKKSGGQVKPFGLHRYADFKPGGSGNHFVKNSEHSYVKKSLEDDGDKPEKDPADEAVRKELLESGLDPEDVEDMIKSMAPAIDLGAMMERGQLGSGLDELRARTQQRANTAKAAAARADCAKKVEGHVVMLPGEHVARGVDPIHYHDGLPTDRTATELLVARAALHQG